MATLAEPAPSAAAPATLTVALAGNPNSGKTTLFNALTGLRQKVANYPGVTVEKKTGTATVPNGPALSIIDLPGTYSLVARSPDEVVASSVLRGLRSDTPAPDVIVAVVDASNLARNLYLVSQLIELGRPLVVALTMVDLAERRGIRLSPERLAEQLGVMVVAVQVATGTGVPELLLAIARAQPPRELELDFSPELAAEVATLARELPPSPRGQSPAAVAERLLIGDEAADLAEVLNHAAVRLATDTALARLKDRGIDPVQADIEAHYRWIDRVVAGSLRPACEDLFARAAEVRQARQPTASDGVDRVLMHRVFGLVLFAVIMASVFISLFWIADPMMGAVEDAVSTVGEAVGGLLPEGPLRDLVVDGIFAGVGAVLVFTPQIALLFLFLALLEDSGYLARAAFLMDRFLSRVGLNGKSFVPLLSSFACAIPGVMAARTIENRRERLATIFVAPFMSCSARLPVYALLIGAFFASSSALVQGGVLLGLYALGVVAAFATALLFKRRNREPAGAFILELPPYRWPLPRNVARAVWTSTGQFITKAGTTIFCLSVILWALAYYPQLPADRIAAIEARATTAGVEPDAIEQQIASIQLEESIAGRLGHALEPIIQPLGYDWKMGIGLISAFAAREVFVSSLAIVYSVGDAEDDPTPLSQAMLADTYADGTPRWTLPVAISLLVYFVLAMQCISTLAIVWRETGSVWWPIGMTLYMNVLAYICSLVTFQVLVRIV